MTVITGIDIEQNAYKTRDNIVGGPPDGKAAQVGVLEESALVVAGQSQEIRIFPQRLKIRVVRSPIAEDRI